MVKFLNLLSNSIIIGILDEFTKIFIQYLKVLFYVLLKLTSHFVSKFVINERYLNTILIHQIFVQTAFDLLRVLLIHLFFYYCNDRLYFLYYFKALLFVIVHIRRNIGWFFDIVNSVIYVIVEIHFIYIIGNYFYFQIYPVIKVSIQFLVIL